MEIQTEIKPEACVFFARDFLATEFPRLGKTLSTFSRVYVVSNDKEAKVVKEHDPDANVYSISDVQIRNNETEPNLAELSFNYDRFLRYYNEREINRIVEISQFIVWDITSKFKVRYYLDEPVSGFINDYFNRRFRSVGAVCLHFHFAWVPGYIFFTQDQAQREPVEVSCLENMTDIVSKHISKRKIGKERPRYVIGYEKKIKILSDASMMFAKGMFRKIFRRGELYLDSDPSPHFFHVRCLIKSLYTSYDSLPSSNDESKYVVLPLHYEPEAVINYFSDYRRQVELAEKIIDTLPAGFKLIIKEHPSQPGSLAMTQWQNVLRCARVIPLMAHADVKNLFAKHIYVVSLGSTFALEAAMYGKPVAVLGGAHFAGAPNIIEIEKPEDWKMLLDVEVTMDTDVLVEWYATFLSRYCVKGIIMRGNTDMSMVSHFLE